jgi:hypothetical protein
VPALAGVVATLSFGGFTFASALPYPIIARTFGLKELTTVATDTPSVGLVIDAPESQVPTLAARLARVHARGSFALVPSPSARTVAALAARGDEILPRLEGEKPTNLLAARRRLAREAHRLRLGRHFYYLAPDPGFTLAEYVAARSVGGTPVGAAVHVQRAQSVGGDDELRAGAIVVVDAGTDERSSRALLGRVLASLRARGLRPVPLGRLLASIARTAATAGVRTS